MGSKIIQKNPNMKELNKTAKFDKTEINDLNFYKNSHLL